MIARTFGQTARRDQWWIEPLLIVLGLSTFIVYSTWAAFQGRNYTFGPYLSPFYSPELFGDSPHAWFGPKPGWWPGWLPFSPALLILWAPGGFRLTCYYYRGAYYKSFWADPPACAVSEPRATYRGEASFPLIAQNIHRFFLRLAEPILLVLAWDALKAFWFVDPATGQGRFGIGLGTLVLVVNVVLLGAYTLGCHSLRHLIGGRKDELSKSVALRSVAYNCVSCLNNWHRLAAWCSLASVGFADLYVRMCAMGIWSDWRLL
jgi:hypothetical protein